MKLTLNEDKNVLSITLSNGSVMQQDRHPQTNAPVTQNNFEDVAKASVPDDEWRDYLKLKGIAFSGVQCSATSQDQAGLLAVLAAYQMQAAAFQPTEFRFENGNMLVLNKDNIQSFIATWMPFRQGFFKASST